jgi:hypothetical protein
VAKKKSPKKNSSPKSKRASALPKVAAPQSDSMIVTESDSDALAPKFIILGNDLQVKQYLKDHPKEIQASRRKAMRALKSFRKELETEKFGKINGVSIELYHKRGYVTMPPQYGLTVRVQTKTPHAPMRAAMSVADPFQKRRGKASIELIPAMHEGVRVKVVESNPRYAMREAKLASSDIPPPVEQGPLTGGHAISPDGSLSWGTLGIVFEQNDGTVCGISCKHVIASGHADQPAYQSAAGNVGRRKVGSVKKSAITNRADVALIHLLGPATMAAVQGVQKLTDQGIDWKILVNPRFDWSDVDQQWVQLFGARTKQAVHGKITSVSGSVDVDNQTFYDPLMVQATPRSAAIVDEGDSGSALFFWDSDHHQLVWIGVVFAMTDVHELVACRLTSAFKAVGITKDMIPASKHW